MRGRDLTLSQTFRYLGLMLITQGFYELIIGKPFAGRTVLLGASIDLFGQAIRKFGRNHRGERNLLGGLFAFLIAIAALYGAAVLPPELPRPSPKR